MTEPQDPDANARRMSDRHKTKWNELKAGVADRNAAAHAVAKEKQARAELRRLEMRGEDQR